MLLLPGSAQTAHFEGDLQRLALLIAIVGIPCRKKAGVHQQWLTSPRLTSTRSTARPLRFPRRALRTFLVGVNGVLRSKSRQGPLINRISGRTHGYIDSYIDPIGQF
jgi:hypothetical protein